MTTASCSLLLLLLSLAELESGPLGITCGIGNSDTCDKSDIRWDAEDNDDNWGDANTDVSADTKRDNDEELEDMERSEDTDRMEDDVLLPSNWLELLADMLNSEAVKRLEEHSLTPINAERKEDNVEFVEPFTLESVENVMEQPSSPNDMPETKDEETLTAQKVILDGKKDVQEEISEISEISNHNDQEMMRAAASQMSGQVDEEKLLPLLWLDQEEDAISPGIRSKRSIVDFDLDPKHRWTLIEGMATNNGVRKKPRERRDIRRRLQLEQLLDELWPLTENMDEEDIVDVFVDYFDDVLENLENEADALHKRRRKRRSLLTTELDMTKPLEIIYPASDRSNRQHVVDLDKATTHRMGTDDNKLDVSLTKRDVKDITRDSDLAQILQWLKALSEGRESEVTAALMVAKKSKDSDQNRMEPVFRTTTAKTIDNLKNNDLSLTLATSTTTSSTRSSSSSRSTRETTTTTEEIIETSTTTTTTEETSLATSSATTTTRSTTGRSTTAGDRRRARFAEQTFELTTPEVPESLRSTDQLDIGMDEHSEHHHKRHNEKKHKKKHKHKHKHKHHSHKEKHEQ